MRPISPSWTENARTEATQAIADLQHELISIESESSHPCSLYSNALETHAKHVNANRRHAEADAPSGDGGLQVALAATASDAALLGPQLQRVVVGATTHLFSGE